MSSPRSAHLLLAVVLALGVQTTYGNPGATVAELRALSCCAGHCDGPTSLPSARTCCGLTLSPSGPAEAPSASGLAPAAPIVSLAPVAAVTLPAPPTPMAAIVPPPGTAPPTFLAHRHLLL